MRKKKNTGLYSFLTSLGENGLKEEKFENILSYLSNASNEMSEFESIVNGNIKSQELIDRYNIIRKDDFIANYLFNHLKEESLLDLFGIIMKGMNNYELCFNDSLLFLCKLINNELFNENIEEISKKCLDYKRKSQEKVSFFKNYLLTSNIWCKNINEKYSNFDEKEETNNLFESIRSKVLSKELNIHKIHLQNELIELEKKFNSQFKQLKHNIKEFSLANEKGISQSKLISTFDHSKDYMSELGINSLYKLSEMPYDNVNGFSGKNEYDFEGYLTQLLIASHNIDAIFQKECKEYFNDYFNDKLNIACHYSSAPVKTRERSILKAKLDYNNKEWPRTSNIIDVVRCSVSFNDINAFLNGFNRFYNEFDYRRIANQKGCIKAIVRIKNDFSELSDNIGSESLENINYCDIKLNVLLEYNNTRIIGEIQFLLDIFLDFKKRQHSIYSFIRNEALYNSLYDLQCDMCNNKSDIIYKKLRNVILSQNINDFSLYLQSLTLVEKYYILEQENEEKIMKLMQDNEWKKGMQLFTIIVKKYKKEQLKTI